MPDKNDDINIIETLRLKTEEIDMDKYLKTTFGGYTKQSVLDYLNVLRKQQQTTADTFYRNIQTAYNEKDALMKANEALQCKIDKLESEYKNLSDSMLTVKLEDAEITMQDIISLKNTISAQEEELHKSKADKSALENKIDNLNNVIDDLQKKIEQTEQEVLAAKEMLITEKHESKDQRNKITELSIAMESKLDEIKYLKAQQSEGKIHELNSKISDLTNQLTSQAEIMAKLNEQIELKEANIAIVTDDNEMHKERINNLVKTVQNLEESSEKLLLKNEQLIKQLEECHKKTIELISERSDETVERLITQRNLDEANSKIAMLEIELQGLNKSKHLKESKGFVENDYSDKTPN